MCVARELLWSGNLYKSSNKRLKESRADIKYVHDVLSKQREGAVPGFCSSQTG